MNLLRLSIKQSVSLGKADRKSQPLWGVYCYCIQKPWRSPVDELQEPFPVGGWQLVDRRDDPAILFGVGDQLALIAIVDSLALRPAHQDCLSADVGFYIQLEKTVIEFGAIDSLDDAQQVAPVGGLADPRLLLHRPLLEVGDHPDFRFFSIGFPLADAEVLIGVACGECADDKQVFDLLLFALHRQPSMGVETEVMLGGIQPEDARFSIGTGFLCFVLGGRCLGS